MKTITKQYELYDYSEISPEAKKNALIHYQNDGFDDYALQVSMDDKLGELLKENGIEPTPKQMYGKLFYSLNSGQGDGVMFYGMYTWKHWTIEIKHHGNYYHAYSKMIDMWDEFGDNPETDDVYKEFDKVYVNICEELQKYGYEQIDYLNSEEVFEDMCNMNEWTFLADGTMFNE